MTSTDFNIMVRRFFMDYLPKDITVAVNTLDSYKTAFKLFVKFLHDVKSIGVNQMALVDFNKKLVNEFFNYLKNVRNNTSATIKIRGAALSTFAKFLSYECPWHADECQKIRDIQIADDHKFKPLNFLNAEQLTVFVDEIRKDKTYGERNFVIISTLTVMALRVSELINLKIEDIHFGTPCYMDIFGKGSKTRQVPIPKRLQKELKDYLKRENLEHPSKRTRHLFMNSRNTPFTRQGIYHMVHKYIMSAHLSDNTIPENICPHGLRHSAAVLYLSHHVDLIYIRDLLGHSSVATTQIYLAGHNPKSRQEAIEAGVKEIIGEDKTNKNEEMEVDEDLILWLEKLSKDN